MVRRLSLVVAAAAALGVFAVPSPAYANELATGCSDDGHNLSAWAYYTPNGATNQWYQFRYLLWGAGTGGKSNVNIWVYENFALRWSYYSPDNLKNNITYTTTPTNPISTNAAVQEWTKFEAIFDEVWGDDRCNTITAKI